MYTCSISDLHAWRAIDLAAQSAALRAHLGRDVPEGEQIPLTTWAEVIPRTPRLAWMLARIDRARAVALAADLAEAAVHLAWLPSHFEGGWPLAAIAAARGGNGVFTVPAPGWGPFDAACSAESAAFSAFYAHSELTHASTAAHVIARMVDVAADAGVDVRPMVLAAI